MRVAIVTGLVGVLAAGIVARAGIATAEPVQIAPPKLQVIAPRRVVASPMVATALQTHKPLTVQEKLKVVSQGRPFTFQPVPEAAFTLSVQNMLHLAGPPVGGLWFTNAPGVYAFATPSPLAYASLTNGNTQSAAVVEFQAGGDKLYLVDCISTEAATITFNALADSAPVGTSTVTPQLCHSTFVVPKQGAPKVMDIFVSGAGPTPNWSFISCEVTPFH